MEFKSLKNLETSFRQIRLFGIVFVLLCAAIVVYTPFGVLTTSHRNNVKRYTCWTVANR